MAPRITGADTNRKLSWIEYKTVRQYQAMGDVLDEFKLYGPSPMLEASEVLEKDHKPSTRNGHFWLTKESRH